MFVKAIATNQTNDLATAAELAGDFRTTKVTILAWLHAGKIPAVVHEGRVIRFSRSEVAAALRTNRCQARIRRAQIVLPNKRKPTNQ